MKSMLAFNLLLLGVFALSCKKDEAFTDCISAKIEAFKQDPGASSIVKINKPDGALYWFKGRIDNGDDVLNEDCELICVENCECANPVPFCDSSHLNHPNKVIWKK